LCFFSFLRGKKHSSKKCGKAVLVQILLFNGGGGGKWLNVSTVCILAFGDT
jgi:hypothetical protein